MVAPLAVGDAGVGHDRHEARREGGEGAHVLGHGGGAGRAVDPDPQRLPGLDHHSHGLDALSAERRARGLDGGGNGDRQAGRGVRAGDERGLDVEGILAGLDQEHVGAALGEPLGLDCIRFHELRERDPAGERERLRGRSHRAGDEAGPRGVGRFRLGARLAREIGSLTVDFAAAVGETVLGEHDGRRAEGVRLDDVRAGGQIASVEVEHDVGPVQDERLVAAKEGLAAVVRRAEPACRQGGAGGAVQHKDAPAQQLRQRG